MCEDTNGITRLESLRWPREGSCRGFMEVAVGVREAFRGMNSVVSGLDMGGVAIA